METWRCDQMIQMPDENIREPKSLSGLTRRHVLKPFSEAGETTSKLVGWRPLPVGWRPSPVGWRQSLIGLKLRNKLGPSLGLVSRLGKLRDVKVSPSRLRNWPIPTEHVGAPGQRVRTWS